MTARPRQGLLERALRGWGRASIHHPWIVILCFMVTAGLTLSYTLDHLKVNTNTADMISLEVPFQQRRLALEKAFPQDIGTGLLVIEGPTPELTQTALGQIARAMAEDPTNFKDITLPDGGPFFETEGLLFLPLEDLERLSIRLSEAQPLIGRLSGNDSLEGYLSLLEEALAHPEENPSGTEPLITALTETLLELNQPHPKPLSWQQRMNPDAQGFGYTQRFIQFRPILHYDAVMPAEATLSALSALLERTLTGDLADVKVLKTGEFILEHEEMETISNGVSAASLASLILVCLTLGFAYRSVRLVIATFLTLTLGLIFSLGFATVAIGQLNLISIGFAVLFIGMGDAYSSHFCLRYRELVLEGHTSAKALMETLGSTGPALTLSAVTAAIGLFAFIPTSYSGVAELGIIAGASMFIALITTFTLLPALIEALPLKPPKRRSPQPAPRLTLANWPLARAKMIRRITLLLTLGACVLLSRVVVDFNPLNLRDPHTESVRTFKRLLRDENTSPMTLSSLADREEEVRRLSEGFKTLPSVNRVLSVFDLVPKDQPEKLALIEDLNLLIGPALTRFPKAPEGKGTLEDLKRLRTRVDERRQLSEDLPSLKALKEALDPVIGQLEAQDETARKTLLLTLEGRLIGPLSGVLEALARQLKAAPVTLETLPEALRARWLSPEGRYRIQITPRQDLGDLEALRRFILEAQSIDPAVTDLPVTYLESMNEVIKAFEEAFGIAFLATLTILLLVLRSIRDTALVLLPLLLAALLTAAMTVVLGIPFNFANIIALPLLFGLGVDSGIHMAHRLHAIERNGGALLDSSEARGVFYGALTTVFSFSSLALTPHRGTASMGLLLAIGLMITLFAALVVLPAFSPLGRRDGRPGPGVKS